MISIAKQEHCSHFRYAPLMAGPTPRQRRRSANLERIKALALDQLADDGASGLSLRRVARELDMVSSAMYRYYPSRDALVTDLLLDAYADLESALLAADDGGPLGACRALRRWALAQPHRFALLYGTPIPGYHAPETTVPAAGGVFTAFALAVAPSIGTGPGPAGPMVEQLRTLAESAGLEELDPRSVELAVRLFALTIGVTVLELNGQLTGTFEPAEHLLAHLVAGAVDRTC